MVVTLGPMTVTTKFVVMAVTTKLIVTAVMRKLVSTAVTTKLVVAAIRTKLVVMAYFYESCKQHMCQSVFVQSLHMQNLFAIS